LFLLSSLTLLLLLLLLLLRVGWTSKGATSQTLSGIPMAT
jgi:hypothetical protein